MIRITIDDQATLDLLKSVYANKLNAASRGARYAMNAKKRAFKEAVRMTCRKDGEPVGGEPVAAVYYCCLRRCDWDAPIKSLQDAIEGIGLACRDDRVIRYAMCFITRPGSGSSQKPARKREIVVDLYDPDKEKAQLLLRVSELLDWGAACWYK